MEHESDFTLRTVMRKFARRKNIKTSFEDFIMELSNYRVGEEVLGESAGIDYTFETGIGDLVKHFTEDMFRPIDKDFCKMISDKADGNYTLMRKDLAAEIMKYLKRED